MGFLATTGQSEAATERSLAFTSPVTAIPLPSGARPRYSPGEPRLVTAPGGAVVLSAHYQPWDCATGTALPSTAQSCVWTSADGKTFALSGGPTDRMTVDVDLARLTDGVLLHTTMTNPAGLSATAAVAVNVIANGVGGSTVSRSTDNGKTWTVSYAANKAVVNDRPFFLADSDDNVLMIYTGVPGGIEAVRSADHGATFGLPTPVSSPDLAWRLVQMGAPAVNRARHELLVPYVVGSELTCTGGGSCLDRLSVARSADHGATWTTESVLALPSGSGVNTIHAVAADERGREYLVYSTGGDTATGQHVWLMRRDSGGRTWSPPRRIDPPGASAMMPALVTGSGGAVALAYYSTPFPDVEQRPRPWHVEAAVSVDGADTFTRAAVSGTAYVGTEADHRATLWDLIGLAADDAGRLHVAWTDTLGRAGAAPTVIRYARQWIGPNLRAVP
jgi:hypothetical protein